MFTVLLASPGKVFLINLYISDAYGMRQTLSVRLRYLCFTQIRHICDIKNHKQKILRVISDSSGEIDPSEDPFDQEIESLPNSNVPNITDPLMEKTNVYCSMKVIFQDHSKRPAFGRINKEKYSNIIKIIKGYGLRIQSKLLDIL